MFYSVLIFVKEKHTLVRDIILTYGVCNVPSCPTKKCANLPRGEGKQKMLKFVITRYSFLKLNITKRRQKDKLFSNTKNTYVDCNTNKWKEKY